MNAQFNFEAVPDEFGVASGLDAARQHVIEALRLTAPYSDRCPHKQMALFMAVAMETMQRQLQEALREGCLEARLLTTHHRPGRRERMLEAGHVLASQPEVERLLDPNSYHIAQDADWEDEA